MYKSGTVFMAHGASHPLIDRGLGDGWGLGRARGRATQTSAPSSLHTSNPHHRFSCPRALGTRPPAGGAHRSGGADELRSHAARRVERRARRGQGCAALGRKSFRGGGARAAYAVFAKARRRRRRRRRNSSPGRSAAGSSRPPAHPGGFAGCCLRVADHHHNSATSPVPASLVARSSRSARRRRLAGTSLCAAVCARRGRCPRFLRPPCPPALHHARRRARPGRPP